MICSHKQLSIISDGNGKWRNEWACDACDARGEWLPKECCDCDNGFFPTSNVEGVTYRINTCPCKCHKTEEKRRASNYKMNGQDCECGCHFGRTCAGCSCKPEQPKEKCCCIEDFGPASCPLHSPLALAKQRVLIWLGRYRDHIEPQAVTDLQDIVDPA